MAPSLRLSQAGNSILNRGFQFFRGELPPGYRYAFTAAVFNDPAFRMLQSPVGWLSFYVLHPETATVHAQLHIHVEAGLATTPLRAPFGSVEISPELNPEILYDFLGFVESELAAAGVSEVMIKNAPDAYDPRRAALVNSFLPMRGYSVLAADIGSVIPVTAKSFADGLHPRKKRKLNQSKGSDFHFVLLPDDAIQPVYDFILSRRRLRGYRLSVTCDDVRLAIERCPRAYALFGVYLEDRLVAASVTVHVNDRILYHFISDHLRGMGPFSPALVLMEGIYDYCREREIAILDLGTSVAGGKPDFNLLNFKRELGAVETVKYTFRKILGR